MADLPVVRQLLRLPVLRLLRPRGGRWRRTSREWAGSGSRKHEAELVPIAHFAPTLLPRPLSVGTAPALRQALHSRDGRGERRDDDSRQPHVFEGRSWSRCVTGPAWRPDHAAGRRSPGADGVDPTLVRQDGAKTAVEPVGGRRVCLRAAGRAALRLRGEFYPFRDDPADGFDTVE
jgi:hypothetical protein